MRIFSDTARRLREYRRKRKREGSETALLVLAEAAEIGIHAPEKEGDSGYDLVVNERTVIPPRTDFPVDVPSRFRMKIPDTHFALIIGRSSTARKLGLLVLPSIIDSGYTGPIFACVYNMTSSPVTAEERMRLAQCVLLPKSTPPLLVVGVLPKTERGTTGFGSTG